MESGANVHVIHFNMGGGQKCQIPILNLGANGKCPPLLAHLSRRLIGELIVYKGIRRPSVVRPSTFSNNISSEAEKPILFIFHI